MWEPVIQSIFDRTAKTQNSTTAIREAWTFDWQSHGEAGRLNRDYLARLDAHVRQYGDIYTPVEFRLNGS